MTPSEVFEIYSENGQGTTLLWVDPFMWHLEDMQQKEAGSDKRCRPLCSSRLISSTR
jgi:hypothetical protein